MASGSHSILIWISMIPQRQQTKKWQYKPASKEALQETDSIRKDPDSGQEPVQEPEQEP